MPYPLKYVVLLCAFLAPAAYAKQQVMHPNPLCDDYVRLKINEYLDTNANVEYDDYIQYKEELTRYCSDMLKNNTFPSDYQSRSDALRSYNRSLD